MEILREYAANSQQVIFELYAPDGVDLVVPTLVTGDVQISIDGSVFANTGSLPTLLPNASSFRYLLSVIEITSVYTILKIVDQSTPKLWLDKIINITTWGDIAKSMINFDKSVITSGVITAIAGDNQTFNLSNMAQTGNAHVGQIIIFTEPGFPQSKVQGRIASELVGLGQITLMEPLPSSLSEPSVGWQYVILASDKQFLDYTGTRAALIDNLAGHIPQTTDHTANIATILADTADIQPKIGTPNVDISTDIATRSSHAASDVDTTLTASHGAGSWTGGTGSSPTLLHSTTIATLTSQINFTLTTGSPSSDSYKGAICVITDAVTATQKAVARILTYSAGSKTLTLVEDPAVFVMAVGDTIDIIASDKQFLNYTALRAQRIEDIFADTNTMQPQVANIQASLPATLINGRISADIGSIVGDAVSPAGLRDTYNGTGYSDPLGPAQQQQLSNLAISGSPNNKVADSVTITSGTLVSGTVATTHAVDGIAQIFNDAAGVLDINYVFNIGITGTPTNFEMSVISNGSNDDLNIVAWDFIASAWVQIGSVSGQVNTTNFNVVAGALFGGMVDAVTTPGEVRIGLQGTGLTTNTTRVDRVFVSFSENKSLVGYAGGAIWVDTINGVAGVMKDVNGVADNPVLTWGDAIALSISTGLRKFHISNNSVIVLTTDSSNFTLFGENWSINVNAQNITGAHITGATVSGTSITSTAAEFVQCKIGLFEISAGMFRECGLMSTVTVNAADLITFERCHSMVSGVSTPVLDFGGAVLGSNVNFRSYSGGIKILNMGSGSALDIMTMEGNGQLILDISVNPGFSQIAVRGSIEIVDNVAGGFVASGGLLSTDANITIPVIQKVLGGATADITAATSGTSFTISNVKDVNGAPITLATDMFAGQVLKATTRSGQATSNVIDQAVMIQSITSSGVVTVKVDDIAGAGFSATPNTTTTSVIIL